MSKVEVENNESNDLKNSEEVFSNNEDDFTIVQKMNIIETVLSSVCNFSN
jgi:hypothetical protein